jgi:hypothetical protein
VSLGNACDASVGNISTHYCLHSWWLYGRILPVDVFNTIYVTFVLSVTKGTFGNRSNGLALSVSMELGHRQ